MSALIGVTPDTYGGSSIKKRTPKEKIVYLWDMYIQAMLDMNAAAVVLPLTDDRRMIRSIADRLNGVVLAGSSYDIPPKMYGEKPRQGLGEVRPERSRFELLLLEEASKRDLPVLGICGGMQTINVGFGGTLYQDIIRERPGSKNHEQKIRKDRCSHQVTISPGTSLHAIASGKKSAKPLKVSVNSTHHQAVKELGRDLEASAVAADGVIEAIESRRHRFILGVQWHPELLYARFKEQRRIFSAFVRAAEAR